MTGLGKNILPEWTKIHSFDKIFDPRFFVNTYLADTI